MRVSETVFDDNGHESHRFMQFIIMWHKLAKQHPQMIHIVVKQAGGDFNKHFQHSGTVVCVLSKHIVHTSPGTLMMEIF